MLERSKRRALSSARKDELSDKHQGNVFRLETRAREFTFMASLRVDARRRRETEFSQPARVRGRVVKGPSHGGKTRNRAILTWAGRSLGKPR